MKKRLTILAASLLLLLSHPSEAYANCAPDPSCASVGDVCKGDGSGSGNPKFAGCICYYDANSKAAGECEKIYVTQENQSKSEEWVAAATVDNVASGSIEDGRVNEDLVNDFTLFPAFKLCKDLTDGGHTDWYLPARTELDLLFRNREAIGGFEMIDYWSSADYSPRMAWGQEFGYGAQFGYFKDKLLAVRCVRRD